MPRLSLSLRDVFWLTLVVALWPLTSRTAEDHFPTRHEERFAPMALGMDVPVIRSAKQLNENVGRLVAIRGVVSDSKLSKILGVEVAAADELKGKEAYAVGILATVKVEKIDANIASDGPGVKYSLYFDLKGKHAEARPISD